MFMEILYHNVMTFLNRRCLKPHVFIVCYSKKGGVGCQLLLFQSLSAPGDSLSVPQACGFSQLYRSTIHKV